MHMWSKVEKAAEATFVFIFPLSPTSPHFGLGNPLSVHRKNLRAILGIDTDHFLYFQANIQESYGWDRPKKWG